MKTQITILSLFTILFSFAQNGKYELLKDKTETNILFDQVFELSKITTEKKEIISSLYFKQVYH